MTVTPSWSWCMFDVLIHGTRCVLHSLTHRGTSTYRAFSSGYFSRLFIWIRYWNLEKAYHHTAKLGHQVPILQAVCNQWVSSRPNLFFVNKVLLEHWPLEFMYMLFMDAFLLQWQSWVVVTDWMASQVENSYYVGLCGKKKKITTLALIPWRYRVRIIYVLSFYCCIWFLTFLPSFPNIVDAMIFSYRNNL